MKKTILIGVCGSVAAYKSAQLVSDLLKLGYDIEVVMTKNATKFIQPMTFEALIKKPVYIDVVDKSEGHQIKHIELAKKADLFIVAPCSANTLAKLANGLCDDMLSTTFLASTCKKLIAPAMNTAMYDNLATQRNIERCLSYGITFVEPGNGLLACGDVGRGKLADMEDIKEMIDYCLEEKLLRNKKVLITAGPTQEAIDPVRYITNHSSGKMGYALAKKAFQLGCDVTLISGPVNLKVPYGIQHISVVSASEMLEAVKGCYLKQDMIIKAAAVGDYRAKTVASNKIKKGNQDIFIECQKNDDILAFLGNHVTKQKLCGFAMETENLIENAQKKCITKNCDLLVANDLTTSGAGFQVDTNKVFFITKDNVQELDLMTKDELSKEILLTLNKEN